MIDLVDDITDAELDAMERQHAGQSPRFKVVDDGDDGLRIHHYEDDGADLGDVATMADEDEAYTLLAQSWCDSRGQVMRLVTALREARRRHAEHDRDFACWRVGATEVDASRSAAASLDGAPSRAMIERHHAEHGGYWLVSRVDVGGGSLRPMVLRLSVSVDGAFEWLRATIPGVDYGAPWNDRPFRAMQGAKFTPLTADGEACECGRGR